MPWTAAAVLGLISAGVLTWSKWWPYGHKAYAASLSHQLTTSSILAVAGRAQSAPSAIGGWHFLHAYGISVWEGWVAALVIGASLHALLPADWLPARTSHRRTGGLGVVLAIPTLFCTACAVPVAVSARRSGASRAFTLPFLVAAPLLNPAVLILLAFVAPWQWVATRIVGGIVAITLTAVLAARLNHDSDDVADSSWDSIEDAGVGYDWRGVPERFVRRLIGLTVVLTPLYAVSMYLLGTFRGDLFPITASMSVVVAVIAAVTLGVVVDLPTAGEIPVLLALTAAGLGTATTGALLITLPAFSIVTLILILRGHGVRASVQTFAATSVAGLVGAVVMLALTR